MTRVESGLDYRRTEGEIRGPTTRVFNCRTMNSEEDEQQMEAVSTESPDSKDSWLRSPKTPNEKEEHLKGQALDNNQHCQNIHTLQTELIPEEEENQEASSDERIAKQEMPQRGQRDLENEEEADLGETEISEEEKVAVGQIGRLHCSSSNSTDVISTEEESVNDELCHEALEQNELHPRTTSEEIVEDDFGHFEEAAEPDEDPKDDSDDEFGDFAENPDIVDAPAIATPSPSTQAAESSTSMLQLAGMDFTCAVSKIFDRFESARPLLTGECCRAVCGRYGHRWSG